MVFRGQAGDQRARPRPGSPCWPGPPSCPPPGPPRSLAGPRCRQSPKPPCPPPRRPPRDARPSGPDQQFGFLGQAGPVVPLGGSGVGGHYPAWFEALALRSSRVRFRWAVRAIARSTPFRRGGDHLHRAATDAAGRAEDYDILAAPVMRRFLSNNSIQLNRGRPKAAPRRKARDWPAVFARGRFRQYVDLFRDTAIVCPVPPCCNPMVAGASEWALAMPVLHWGEHWRSQCHPTAGILESGGSGLRPSCEAVVCRGREAGIGWKERSLHGPKEQKPPPKRPAPERKSPNNLILYARGLGDGDAGPGGRQLW